MEEYRKSVQNFSSVLSSDEEDFDEEDYIEFMINSTEDDLMQCLPCYDPAKAQANSSLPKASSVKVC